MVMQIFGLGSSDPFFQNFFENLSVWLNAHLINLALILFIAWLIRKFGPPLVMQVVKGTVRNDMYPTEVDRKKRIQTLQSIVLAVFRIATWIVTFLRYNAIC